jgi:hypothetical protein
LPTERGSPADRYFAYAALWDVAGYIQLCKDRGIPVPERDALRGELAILLRMLDPRQVRDGYVAVQQVLARLDGLAWRIGEHLPEARDIDVGAPTRTARSHFGR